MLLERGAEACESHGYWVLYSHSSDMIEYFTLSHIWLDWSSKVKVPAAAHEGEAGFASDCSMVRSSGFGLMALLRFG